MFPSITMFNINSTPNCSSSSFTQNDRFISSRSDSKTHEIAKHKINHPNSNYAKKTEGKGRLYENTVYEKALAQACTGEDLTTTQNKRILNTTAKHAVTPTKSAETIVLPFKERIILDAKGLKNDVYTNVLSLSSTNLLAYALGKKLYTCDLTNNKVTYLPVQPEGNSYFKSVHWTGTGKIAYGTNYCDIKLTDLNTNETTVLSDTYQNNSISVLTHTDSNTLFAGSSNGTTYIINTHSGDKKKLTGHKGKVCSLAVSPDKNYIATGGNDNIAYIFDLRKEDCEVAQFKQHKAAVLGMQWYDNQTVISGGGSADKKIRAWKALTGEQITSIDTKSQVSNLFVHGEVITTTHGFHSNSICRWKIADRQFHRIYKSEAQTDRILHAAMNKNTLVTSIFHHEKHDTYYYDKSTIKIWDLAEPKKKQSIKTTSIFERYTIR